MANIAIIPDQVAAGAEVDLTSGTAVNEGQGGISGRTSLRQPPMRNFHITVGPDYTREVRAIFVTHRRRWPVAIKDFSEYSFTDEVLALDSADTSSTFFALRKKYLPATGTRFWHYRILIPDQRVTPLTVKKNGVTQSFSLADFGLIGLSSYGTGDVVTASGRYLVPCCFVADELNIKAYSEGSSGPQLGIPDCQLREIQEAELISLMAQTDDSV